MECSNGCIGVVGRDKNWFRTLVPDERFIMPFGSILASLRKVKLDAADGQSVTLQNGFLTRTALRFIGVPHMGLRIRAQLVMEAVRRTRPKVIADAGSGNGLYTLVLAGEGYTVHAFEIDRPKATRVAEYAAEIDLGKVHVAVADLTDFANIEDSADLVICSDVLEHIAADAEAVRGLGNLVKPGGFLFVTVPRISAFAARIDNRFGHVRIGYDEESLESLLSAANFEIHSVGQFFKTFGRIAWSADRALRGIAPLRALLFWPLYGIALLDKLLPAQQSAGGLYMLARAPESEIEADAVTVSPEP